MATKKEKFILTDIYDECGIPVDWRELDPNQFKGIPGHYLYNIGSITENGKIIDKTVVYLVPIGNERFQRGVVRLEGKKSVIGVYDDIY